MVGSAETFLNAFAQELLSHRADLRTHSDLSTHETAIEWDGIEKDAIHLVALLRNILTEVIERYTTAKTSGIDLLKIFPIVSEELSDGLWATVFFQHLDSKEIRVTPGHLGITPFKHIKNVLEWLIVSTQMQLDEVLTLVLLALFHDGGKSLSVGVTEIDQLMEKFPQRYKPQHSYPDHSRVSEMMLRALLQQPTFIAFVDELDMYQLLPRERWEDILVLIRYHHGFEEVAENSDDLGISFKQIILLFFFKFADNCATAEYVPFWEQMKRGFSSWVERSVQLNSEENRYFRRLADAVLAISAST